MSARGHSPPRWIDSYLAIDRLAVGGMAEIALAVHVPAYGAPAATAELVALKLLLPHLADDDDFRAMFAAEGALGLELDHPHVVRVYSVHADAPTPYMVMEWVDGTTLIELAEAAGAAAGRALPPAVAVDLLAQACAGAHAAHELVLPDGQPAEIVHRDLSPHNLVVDARGRMVVLDFGIAKSARSDDTTATGVLKGKLRYMSPEQANQGSLDRRSDVYTLGVVAWELLAGERLFDGQTELQMLQAVAGGQTRRLDRARPELPAALVRAVHRALARDPAARFPTAAAFAAALQAACPPDHAATVELLDALLGERRRARAREVAAARQRADAFLDLAPTEEVPSAPDPSSLPTDRAAQRGGPPHKLASAVEPTPAPPAAADPGRARARPLGIGLALAAAAGAIALSVPLVEERPAVSAPIAVGLAPSLDPDVLRRDLEPTRAHLESQLRRPVELRVAGSYAELGQWIADGAVQLASLPPNLMLELQSAGVGVQPLAVKRVEGSSSTDGVLLVRTTSAVRDLADLRGTTICIPDPQSTTGSLLPRAALRRAGLDPDADVVIHASGGHSQALRDLHDGVCDAAGTFSTAYVAAEVAGPPSASFRVLALTGRSPHDAFAGGPLTDPALALAAQAALLGFRSASREGAVERITAYERPAPDRYDDLRAARAADAAP